MNVLLLTNELRYTCGVTSHLLHLSKGLLESGDVKLFIICGGGNGIERFKDIDVEIISDARFLHVNRSFSTFIGAINFLVRFTGKNNIELYHSHTHYAAAIAQRASILTRVITIQTNHGILADKSRLKPFSADRYVAINDHIMSYIIENKIAVTEETAFIRCGIPLRNNPPAKTRGILRITAASRLVHEKGLDIYIKAISLLPENIRIKADFFIAGEGEQKDELKKLDNSHGTKIHFTGRITDMTGYLSDTHILVHPSRSKSEGFPAILIEAGEAGCLVVSSNFEGVKDVIEDGVNGLLFEKENTEQLAQILDKIVTDFESYRLPVVNFQKKINEEFRIETMIKKHLELYKECLQK